MLENILSSAVAGLIVTIISWVAGNIYRYIRRCENNLQKPTEIPKKKIVQRQFFYSLFFFIFSLSAFWTVNFIAIKVFAGILSLFTFLFVWGSFDAAFAFYPSDDTVEIPPDDAADGKKNEVQQ